MGVAFSKNMTKLITKHDLIYTAEAVIITARYGIAAHTFRAAGA